MGGRQVLRIASRHEFMNARVELLMVGRRVKRSLSRRVRPSEEGTKRRFAKRAPSPERVSSEKVLIDTLPLAGLFPRDHGLSGRDARGDAVSEAS